jgi:hypothetical protein
MRRNPRHLAYHLSHVRLIRREHPQRLADDLHGNPASQGARGRYESRAFLSSTCVVGSGGVQDHGYVERLRIAGKPAAQKCFEALAHIRGDRISPQLLPQGDRLAVGLQEPPAILAVGNVRFKGVPEAWLEGVFEIIDNEVDHLSTPQHRW